MTERKQPTPVDAELYDRFRRYVQNKHDGTRGVLREELELAMENHLSGSNPTEPIHRIENDVAKNKALLSELAKAVSDSDGGEVAPAPSPSNTDRTHTHGSTSDGVCDKPHPKATVDEKAEWLIGEVFDDRESGAYVRKQLIEDVRKHYSLSDDAVERLADAMLTKVGSKDTPQDNDLIAWGDRYDSLKEQAREQARKEADADFDAIDDAERGDG